MLGLPLAITTFFAGMALVTLLPQVGIADAAEVTLPSWAVTVAVLAGAAGGLLGAWVAGSGQPPPDARGRAPDGAIRADLGDEVAVWRGQTPTSRVMQWLAAGLLVTGAVVWWLVDPGPAIVLLVIAALLLASSRYEVAVVPEGLALRGVLGWPRTRVALTTLVSAETCDADPFEFGGWGWRIRGDTTAVVTRRGPAVRLERSDGSDLVISLENPAEVAGLVNGLIDRREATRDASGRER